MGGGDGRFGGQHVVDVYTGVWTDVIIDAWPFKSNSTRACLLRLSLLAVNARYQLPVYLCSLPYTEYSRFTRRFYAQNSKGCCLRLDTVFHCALNWVVAVLGLCSLGCQLAIGLTW